MEAGGVVSGSLKLTLAELLAHHPDVEWETMAHAIECWPRLGPCPLWVEVTEYGTAQLFAGRRYRF